jgi:hypothetical protein
MESVRWQDSKFLDGPLTSSCKLCLYTHLNVRCSSTSRKPPRTRDMLYSILSRNVTRNSVDFVHLKFSAILLWYLSFPSDHHRIRAKQSTQKGIWTLAPLVFWTPGEGFHLSDWLSLSLFLASISDETRLFQGQDLGSAVVVGSLDGLRMGVATLALILWSSYQSGQPAKRASHHSRCFFLAQAA